MLPLLVGLAHAHIPILYVFGPDDDWCGFLNQTSTSGGATYYPGDVIVLTPGEYGACAFTAPVTDNDTEYTVVQSQDFEDPARFVHDGSSEATLDVTGTHLFMYGLRFEGVPAGRSAVRIRNANEVWVRFGDFRGVEGTGIRVEGGASGVWVLDDRFEGAGTAVHLGCEGCEQEIRVRNSIFTVGTGVLAELGATVEVSDAVFDGGALGVRVVGGRSTSMLSANLFLGTDTAMDVAGGPALVRNSIVHAGSVALRARQDGGEWTGVRVLGNSFTAGEVVLDGFSDGSFEVVDNAGLLDLGPGNVDCSGGGCWVDPEGRNFHAPVGSPLRGAGLGARDDALYEDFCGKLREDPRTAGALQAFDAAGWGPFEVGFKEDYTCVLLDPPSGETGDTGFHETGEVTDRRCGCAGGPAGAPWLLLPWMIRVRRRA